MAAKFSEVFEEYAPDNIMFIVQRDMLTRLNELYGVAALPDFAERTFGKFVNLDYPAFALDVFRGASTEGENFVENDSRFEALIRVVDADAAAVTQKAIKYARAFKTVIRGATRADWIRNISSPEIMPLFITISWEYGLIGKNPNVANQWIRDIDFEISFRFNER